MKRRSLIASIAVLAVLALASFSGLPNAASAADVSSRMKVNVPFAFNLGATEFPAGPYIVERSGSGLIQLRNTSNWKSGISLVSTGELKRAIPGPQLVFHKYGDKYFLARMWDGINDTAYRFPSSPKEREVARQLKDRLAKDTISPELITVGAVPAS